MANLFGGHYFHKTIMLANLIFWNFLEEKQYGESYDAICFAPSVDTSNLVVVLLMSVLLLSAGLFLLTSLPRLS